MFTKERVMERHLLGGKGVCWYFVVKNVKCSLSTIQQKLLPLNLMCEERWLQHFLSGKQNDKEVVGRNFHCLSHGDVHICHRGIGEVKISSPNPFPAHIWASPRHLQVFVFEGYNCPVVGKVFKVWH